MIDLVSSVMDFVSGLLHNIIGFVIMIVNLILMPIDLLLSTLIPNFAELTSFIVSALNVASGYIGYCLDSVGFYPETIILFVAFLTIKLTLPLQTWVVKLAVRWYKALKF